MRPINTDILTAQSELEPFNVIGIQWRDTLVYYSDKDKILQLSAFSAETQLDGAGSAASVSITLDDHDGELKAIIDNTDIQKKRVVIYQCFSSLPFDQKFPVFEGEIATPIEWSEAEQTLTFAAVTKLTEREIGFAPESGQFPVVHQSLLGKPWPLVFGRPKYVPCQRLQEIPVGTVVHGFGVPDPSIQYQVLDLFGQAGVLRQEAYNLLVAAAFAHFAGDDAGAAQLQQQAVQLQEQAGQMELDARNLLVILAEQEEFYTPYNEVIGGYKFPQHKQLVLKIGDTLFNGTFNGNRVFLQPLYIGIPQNTRDDNEAIQAVLTTGYTPRYTKGGFVYIGAGSQITIIGDYAITWIANILPSTNVKVYAYKTVNGLRSLTRVPKEFYSVRTLAFGTLKTTAIIVKRPLSTISYFANEATQLRETLFADSGQIRLAHVVASESWEDDIFVTLTSSVGPNPVDVIKWLIQTYTDKLIDNSSFNTTKPLLAAYPTHFVFFNRPNVYDAIKDIAYQSRCAVWLTDNVFHIKFLPLEVPAVATITIADILRGSLIVSASQTDNLVTKYVATWRPDYRHQDANSITLRYNVTKYGSVEQDYDYYCLTDLETVRKVATFWLIRNSNTWKKVQCKLTIAFIGLENFDTVLLDLGALVSDAPVKAIVESVSYDTENNDVTVTFWLPIRWGSMKPYIFAWPGGIDQRILFPTFYEITGGSAGAGQFVQGVTGILPNYTPTSPQVFPPRLLDPLSGFPVQNQNLDPESTSEYHISEPGSDFEHSTGDAHTYSLSGFDLGGVLGGKVVVPKYVPSDYGKRRVSDVGEIAPARPETDITPLSLSTPITADYDFKSYPPIQPQVTQKGTTFPGELVGGSGDTYQFKIYPSGLSGTTTTVSVKILQLDPTDTLHTPLWLPVSQVIKGDGTSEYFAQPPVWRG